MTRIKITKELILNLHSLNLSKKQVATHLEIPISILNQGLEQLQLKKLKFNKVDLETLPDLELPEIVNTHTFTMYEGGVTPIVSTVPPSEQEYADSIQTQTEGVVRNYQPITVAQLEEVLFNISDVSRSNLGQAHTQTNTGDITWSDTAPVYNNPIHIHGNNDAPFTTLGGDNGTIRSWVTPANDGNSNTFIGVNASGLFLAGNRVWAEPVIHTGNESERVVIDGITYNQYTLGPSSVPINVPVRLAPGLSPGIYTEENNENFYSGSPEDYESWLQERERIDNRGEGDNEDWIELTEEENIEYERQEAREEAEYSAFLADERAREDEREAFEARDRENYNNFLSEQHEREERRGDYDENDRGGEDLPF